MYVELRLQHGTDIAAARALEVLAQTFKAQVLRLWILEIAIAVPFKYSLMVMKLIEQQDM